ncbi:MAG TPA: thiamine pyrophosphate-binding protein [Burkholderiaceae bacterium]|nr:thiamine pyrophosphate-binding protein [Burkholderiaceae bacterium]
MTTMTGGEALALQLVREGVTDVFGIPGVQLDWAVDGLVQQTGRLRLITPRHEQATTYMADGYARLSGRPGVAMVVPGPGVLNALAGLSTAWACSSPVLLIAGQIPSQSIGKGLGLLHEIPGQSQMLRSLTKWHALARTPQEIPSLVSEAFAQLREGRPRPVALEIPPDVLQAKAEIALSDPVQRAPRPPDREAIAAAARLLAQARLPVIWAGGGAAAAGAGAELAALARRLRAPVLLNDHGAGELSADDPWALPALAGRALLPHADVVLVLGSRFVDGRGAPFPMNAASRRIGINADPADLGEPRRYDIALVADAREGARALLQALDAVGVPAAAAGPADGPADGPSADPAADPAARPAADPATRERLAQVAALRGWCTTQFADVVPQVSWAQALRAAMPDDAVLVSELTQVGYYANVAFPVRRPRGLLTPGFQGTLGYGYPTALGAAFGAPQRRVVSITGDGGFGWSLQELATAARYQVPATVVVFADGRFGNVHRMQQNQFGRGVGTELHNPDFVALARSFGVDAQQADSPEALQAALTRSLASAGPSLIAVPVGEMASPWHLWHTYAAPPRPAPPNPLGPPPG